MIKIIVRNRPVQVIFSRECGVVEYPPLDSLCERRGKHVGYSFTNIFKIGIPKVHSDGEHVLHCFNQTMQA